MIYEDEIEIDEEDGEETSVETPEEEISAEEESAPEEATSDSDDSSQVDDDEKKWYVINTFSKRERQVKNDIEARAEAFKVKDKIFRVLSADHDEPVFDDDGKPKLTKDKATGKMVQKYKTLNYYPGYVFVEMIMDDQTWFIVRNTPGVSGITGSSGKGAKPIPIPREEIEPVLKRLHIDDPDIYSDYKPGEQVKVLSGLFGDSVGTIQSIDSENSEATITVIMFGRPQQITEKFSNIEKAQQ